MSPVVWSGLIGLIVGLAAKILLLGRRAPQGLIATALLGIAGSYVGSFLGQFFGVYESGEYAGFGGSVVGAGILISLWNLVFKKPKPEPSPLPEYAHSWAGVGRAVLETGVLVFLWNMILNRPKAEKPSQPANPNPPPKS
jgi:uncharacterized membrane protein YeaQ/YmgE (transglycosylase-associated protein family)